MAEDISVNLSPTLQTDPNRPESGYEYLDHTADVQLHAWGRDLKSAYEKVATAMFGYMTDLEKVEESSTLQIEVKGHDLESVLFNFLDEWLFNFSAEPNFIPFKIDILDFVRPEENSAKSEENRQESEEKSEEFVIKAVGYGETFDLDKHPQGTEVKAITYSAMQIRETENFSEVFVIIDI